MPVSRRLLLPLALLLAGPALADGPGPRPVADARRGPAAEWDDVSGAGAEPPAAGLPARLRPARRVTGGPDYVGSDYGLGKPAFYGLGSRPDWGRSHTD